MPAANITQAAMVTRFRVVSDVTKPNATVSTLRTFAAEDGRAGLKYVPIIGISVTKCSELRWTKTCYVSP